MASDDGQPETLEEAVELALRQLYSGPPLQAFGIAREDCALVHMDYFSCIHSAEYLLVSALARARGVSVPEAAKRWAPKPVPCDCRHCTSPEEAEAARERHRAAYTKVAAWAEE